MKLPVLRLLSILSIAAANSVHADPAVKPAYPLPSTARSMTTQFTYSATLSTLPSTAGAVDLWIPIPSDSPWQEVTAVKVTAPYPYTHAKQIAYSINRDKTYGDRMVYLRLDHPETPVSVDVAFTVHRHEPRVLDGADDTPENDMPERLSGDSLVPVGGRFQTIADGLSVSGRSRIEKERAFFDNIVSTMHYDYHKVSPRYAMGDAAFVCDYKQGNCTDLHSYMAALSRTAGIPAVIEFGFPLTGIPVADPVPADGTVSGYHCWLWFQDAEGGAKRWIPVDAADARRWQDIDRTDVKNFLFGDLLLPRSAVAISRGRDIVLDPPQKGAPLNYFIYPYAEADGTSTPVSWKISYHVLQTTGT